MAEPIYVMATDEAERARLQYQATLLAPTSRRLMIEAGFADARRILDVGCGPGDVSFLAAEVAGPKVEIVGIDRDPAQVALATTRAAALGLGNVRFEVGDLLTFEDAAGFDAVVGRFVMIHTREIDAAMDHLASLVRPGGVLAFHELQTAGGWPITTSPRGIVPDSVASIGAKLLHTLVLASGAEDLVVRLPASMSRLGPVRSHFNQTAAVGPQAVRALLVHVVETARLSLAGMRAVGAVTEAEIDFDAMLRELDEALARPEAQHVVMDGYPEVTSFVRIG